ncbi:MAG TPA: hypothetical protein PKC97_05985 [Burkholderiaceae bacterium]|nr:hypothetical protein [Burkholderiaceae bacterium]
MTTSQTTSAAADAARRIFDNAAAAAPHASSRRGVASRALDDASKRADGVHDAAASLGHQTLDLMRSSARQLSHQARYARDATIVYVRHEPVKSMLMAAAVGAGLVAIASYLTRRH